MNGRDGNDDNDDVALKDQCHQTSGDRGRTDE
jgi:hypothetical protein